MAANPLADGNILLLSCYAVFFADMHQSAALSPDLSTTIRILAEDNNTRGDLFGKLMADLFIALGYEQPRLNVHKSGREVDLIAYHRLESRRAIGECKATLNPVGGDDLNKFAGVLDVEHEPKYPTTGYFISLAGFKETAIEQERQRRKKIILLSGTQVLHELIRGRILISAERAVELAGRCCTSIGGLVLDRQLDLLAHERGWVWTVYYGQEKLRTHFVLVHSDGTLLAHSLAGDVIYADTGCGGMLHRLICLNPKPALDSDTGAQVENALVAYREYLANECGFVQLDGLPTDSHVGSRRFRLENLFVPLHLDISISQDISRKPERCPVGAALTRNPRLAILAPPGGGKSTLLKYLAIGYGDPARRRRIGEDFPACEWLPLFFRCRELRELARGSFADLLDALAQREPVRLHAAVFRAYVDRALMARRVLLLVDGLDEIPDPADRAAFVCTLRSAVRAYLGIGFVVTSREAGFRHIAAHLAPLCTQTKISAFDAHDVTLLTVSWYLEVVADTEKARADAEQLALSITQNDRILRLATNPLLLTTLLLVKRWLGTLPTRRAVLYGKAVEVLLMTWNTEGHDPIPEEEAVPQLCYVASAMMLEGLQKVSRPRLAALLQEARKLLPMELGYVKDTVEGFIHRVEDRSSLLVMTGYDIEDGSLYEFFEFRHLTFQEFLTARSMVHGWYPGHRQEDTLVDGLQAHFTEGTWREVISLAAVLGGKATEPLIQRLTEQLTQHQPGGTEIFLALAGSLADEAAARPETIRAALRQLVRLGVRSGLDCAAALARGKYGADFRAEAQEAFLSAEGPELAPATDSLLAAVWWQTVETENIAAYARAGEQFVNMLSRPSLLSLCEGVLGISELSVAIRHMDKTNGFAACKESIRQSGTTISRLLFTGEPTQQFVALRALETIGSSLRWTISTEGTIERLWRLWHESPNVALQQAAVRALTAQPLGLTADRQLLAQAPYLAEALLNRYDQLNAYEKAATIIVAWNLNLLTNKKIMLRLQALISKYSEAASALPTLSDLLKRFEQPAKSKPLPRPQTIEKKKKR